MAEESDDKRLAHRERERFDALKLTPLYGCAVPGCADEFSFAAEHLRWAVGHGESGFYCDMCLSGGESWKIGRTLAEVLNDNGT